VALVTGAGSGIGRRFARVLAAQGAAVAIAGRRLDKLEETAAEIATDGGGKCLPVQLDLTDAAALKAAVDGIENELGLITILVNNAGIPDAQWAAKMPVELVDAVLDTNVRAPFLLACDVAARLMKAKSPGRIVNVSSMGAFTYGGGAAALYSVTKAAINRMTEALSVEWAAFGINVNAIAPGAVNSEMMDGMISRLGPMHERFPRKRMGEPHQLDTTLLYLLSEASEAVTGTVIKVDDGQGPK
jgi:NAD(P)-dependent dehydrogenase (short-subunit alcohol dehydrogenase family)